MTRVSLISASADLRQRLRPLTGDTSFSPAGGPGDPATLLSNFQGAPPEVLILDCRADVEGKLALAAMLVEVYPATGVLLVSDRASELALPALRAGVQDILSPEASMEEFGAAVESIAEVTRNRVAQFSEVVDETPFGPQGKIISVMSPKGGVGKTTVSTNIAIGLAKREPGSTVIVDLDIQFGDVASALNLEPTRFLGDAVGGAARYDAMVLKTMFTQHETGLHALCAPNLPSEADEITAEDVSHLVKMLTAEFRYVVLDTAPGMSDTTLAALDQTTDLVLLTGMDVPGIRGLRKELDTLTELGVSPTSRQIVLNFADSKGLLTLEDVEATLKTRVDVVLPRSKAAIVSVNQGVPLLQMSTKNPLTKQLNSLVDRLVIREPQAVSIPSRPQPWWRRSRQVAAA